MHHALILFLFLQVSLMHAQASQYVYPDFFGRANQLLVDEENGDFYVEYFDLALLSTELSLYAYDSEGVLRWEKTFSPQSNQFIPSRNPENTILYDLGGDRMLYLGAPGVECDFPYDNFLALLIDKNDGSFIDSLSLGGFLSLATDPSIVNSSSYSINDDRNQVVFSAEQQLWQLSITADALALTAIMDDFQDVAPVYAAGDSIAYAFPEGDPDQLILLDLGTNVSNSYPIPDILTNEVAISAEGAVLLATADSLYRFNFASASTTTIGPLNYDTYKHKPGQILFHDREADQYVRYFPEADSLGEPESYLASGSEVYDVDFYQDEYLLAGAHQFDGERRRFGFWHRDAGPTPMLSTNHSVGMADFSLDSLIFFSAFPPSPMTGGGGFAAHYTFSATIVNLGMEPLTSVFIEFPVQGSFFCGPFSSTIIPVDLPPLMPGDNFVFQDTIRIYGPFNPDGVYNLSTRACVGRPNGELDLSYEDNCGSATAQYIFVNTQDFNPRQARQLKVSPNPADGRWIISDLPDGLTQWQLYDLNGRRVISGTWFPGSGQQRLELPQLASGLYFLTARGEAGAYQAKLMKR